MKRSTTHDPKYKIQSNDGHSKFMNFMRLKTQGKPQDPSEESSSRDDSNERYADDSDDDGDDVRGDHGWKASARKTIDRNYAKEYSDAKNQCSLKVDKITQKNLASPTPSLQNPSTWKGLMPQARSNMSKVKSFREPENSFASFVKSSRNAFADTHNIEEKNPMCYHHHHHHHHHQPHAYADKYNEKISDASRDDADDSAEAVNKRNFSFEADASSKNATNDGRYSKAPDSFNEETGNNVKCSECSEMDRGRGRKMKKASDSEKELIVHDSFHPKASAGENKKTLQSSASEKPKEKLVYVVEEEGKDATKLETDLFTVNEILTIKKDLLELSEFAKKLKKLKEMKKESDKGKNTDKLCHCKPAADLLRDVNRRIEALEARQEELEKGSGRDMKRPSDEYDPKKMEETKTLSHSFPSEAIKNYQKELIQNSMISQPEIIVSRAEEFYNDPEIVNELLDIKTQLHKLERRKMSKEPSTSASPTKSPGAPKKRDHAIAVFSSKTYILTAPNALGKGQQDKSYVKSASNKAKDITHLDDLRIGKSKTEKTRENIFSWLRDVPTDSNDTSLNELGLVGEVKKPRKKGKESNKKYLNKCSRCKNELSNQNFEDQARFSEFYSECEYVGKAIGIR